MSYDPERRQSMRWDAHDYRQPGAYFVTILTRNRACVFGTVQDDAVHLSEVGGVARDCWQAIPDHHKQVTLDAYVIMPNHVHGLVIIQPDGEGAEGAGRKDTRSRVLTADSTRPTDTAHTRRFGHSVAGSLSTIIGSYKAAVTRYVRRSLMPDFQWHRNFHDRVVRNAEELERIRHYIRLNPSRWTEDRHHRTP